MGKGAGNSANTDKKRCIKGFNGSKKIKKPICPLILEKPTHKIECVVENHAENSKAPNFIKQMYSLFVAFVYIHNAYFITFTQKCKGLLTSLLC